MNKISTTELGLDIVLNRLGGSSLDQPSSLTDDDSLFADALSTGFTDLDRLTGGIRSGLIIVAGRTLHGADTLHRCLVEAAMFEENTEGKVLAFNTTLSEEDLYLHLLSSLSRVEREHLLRAKLSDEDWARVSSSFEFLKDNPKLLTVNQPFLYLENIEEYCREAIESHGALTAVAIDSLQAIRTTKAFDNRYLETAEITRTLKALTVKYNLPFIVKSNLNRNLELRTDKRPILNDLRDSGTIEDDATLVLLTYIESVYKPEFECQSMSVMEVIVPKNENGDSGIVELIFSPRYSRVDNYVKEQ